MKCCRGNKKQVFQKEKAYQQKVQSESATSKIRHNKIRAAKIYGTNDQQKTGTVTKGFVPINDSNIPDYSRITKPQNYGQQSSNVHASQLIGNKQELSFKLDQPSGVSNTFEIPTYDYMTCLNHNIFYNLNKRSKYQYDDGNKSTMKTK